MTKRIVLTLMAVGAAMVLAPATLAETPAGGPIFSNTTWTAANSPYVVTSSIIVGFDATLTIEPGVEVRIDPGLGIQIGSPDGFGGGAMVAIGTVLDPIVFTSSVETPGTPAPGDWNSITFTNVAADAVYSGGVYMSGSTLQHCIVEYAGGGGASTGAVTIDRSSPYLDSCVIRYNSRPGVWADLTGSPALVLTNCNLVENVHTQQGGGAYVANGSGHKITGNLFDGNIGNAGAGLALNNAGGVVVASNSFIDNASSNNGGGFWGNGVNTLQFTGNALTGNSASSGGGAFISGTTPTVSDNTATGNAATSNGGGFWIQGDNVQFEDNVVTGNTSNSTGGGILHNGGNGGTYQGNTISGNTASSVGGLYVNGINIDVVGNEMNDNTATGSGGVGGGFYATNAANLLFSNNTVDGNSVDGTNGDGGGIYHNSGNNATYAGNVVSNNDAMDLGGGLLVQGSGHAFSGNSILNNGAGSSGAGVYLNASNTTWTSNVVTGNEAGDDGGGFFVNQVGTSLAGIAPADDCNTVSGNLALRGPEVFNNVTFNPDGSGDCDASYVCWGTEVPAEIAAGIWDYFDDTTKGVVITTPVVGGPILVDTTWTLAGSPYTVMQGVIVGGGATLTIEAGVEVRLAPDMAITVGGNLFGAATLVAMGTELSPIVFTSAVEAPESPAPGDWNTILFADLAADAVYDLDGYVSGSILQHCIVEYGGAGDASTGAVTITRCSPFIDSCTIRLNARSGIRADLTGAPPLVLANNAVAQNVHGGQGGGVYVANGAGHMFVGNTVSGNVGGAGGGFALNTAADVTVTDNLFEDNASNNNGGGFWGNNVNALEFTGNTMTGNSASSGGGAFVDGTGVVLDDNSATENSATSNGGGFWIQGANAVVTDNVVSNNTSNSTGGGILHNGGNSALYEGNVVNANTASSVGGLYVNGSGISVVDNQFSANSVTGSSGVAGGFYATNAANLEFSGNIVTDNVAQGSNSDGGGVYHNSGNAASYVGNTITGNSATDLGGGLFVQGSGHVFSGNLIDDNFAGNNGGGMYINGANSTWTINAITNNEAISNGGGVYNIQTGTSFAGDEMAGDYNVIAFNTAQLGAAIYHNVSSGNNLPAQYVCWGTTNAQEVTQMTYDFFDNSSLGIILFAPLVEDPDCAGMPAQCVGDLTDDQVVDGADLGILLGLWGPCPGCAADLNDDGQVNGADLGILLGAWGPCPL
ncbi:MAG: right-handed parallel beta-helix repeat-containing protein [Phycisphaerales bacterium]|nr:right-handed parallel beta-helix repeat-containing protein [Phycisphaerales bacterium]